MRVASARELNRALLARQGLLAREAVPVATVLERLVGLQAQEPPDPYVGLWSRIADFDPEELSGLLERREAVRVSLMRGTIHLVTADDCVALRAIVQDVHERTLQTQFGRRLAGLDREALLAAGRELLHEAPRTPAELGRALAARLGEEDAEAMQLANRYHHALVQVPPRGLWRRSGAARHALAEDWLGRPLGTDPDPAPALERYLAAFGPASVADMRTWCGVSGLREVVEGMRPRLEVVRDEAGRELFDVPGGAWADPATPAPVRFLPVYDNVLLSHADRSRIVPEGLDWARRIGDASFLVDGFVGGTWRHDRKRREVQVRPFGPPAAQDRDAVAAEAAAVAAFLGADVVFG